MHKHSFKLSLYIILLIFNFSCTKDNKKNISNQSKTGETVLPFLDEKSAEKLITLSLECVDKKFPYSIGYRFDNEDWIKPHYEVTPSFYGCWDWHSAVHGHWAMVKVLKKYPEISVADSLRIKLRKNLSKERLEKEFKFFEEKSTKTFERTYGWAWLLKLYSELYTWNDEEGRMWLQNLEPLAKKLSINTIEFLKVLSSPLRPGTHANTAFSFSLMVDYAKAVGDDALFQSIKKFSEKHFISDVDCPTDYEPSGTDFLSPCMAEASLMSKLMNEKEYQRWLNNFLPPLNSEEFSPLRSPPIVLDKEDPGIGHLIGLMFHRAWTMNQVSYSLPKNDRRKNKLRKIALDHAKTGYSLLFDSGYGGAHWLGTFALYMYDENEMLFPKLSSSSTSITDAFSPKGVMSNNNFPDGIMEDNNSDGVVDYINAKIYVSDNPTSYEIAAASNIAARFAFESLSIDLPIGHKISDFNSNDSSLAIIIGNAANNYFGENYLNIVEKKVGNRKIVAIKNIAIAESWAQSLFKNDKESKEVDNEKDSGKDEDTSKKMIDNKIKPNNYSLSQLYTIKALYRDSNEDFIPDKTAMKVYIGDKTTSINIIDFAARIALETTGIQLPLVKVANNTQKITSAVLIGSSNDHIKKLIREKKFKPKLKRKEGRIEIVRNAFKKDHNVLVIVGKDNQGEQKAIEHISKRIPYVWNYGKEFISLNKVEDDIRRFFSIRSPAGQASANLYKARRIINKLKNQKLLNPTLKIFQERSDNSILDYMKKEFSDYNPVVANIDVFSGDTIINKTIQIPWEVDVVRKRFKDSILSKVKKDSNIEMLILVSESPKIRSDLEKEFTRALVKAGIDQKNININILSSYKQGYSWLNDIQKNKLSQAKKITISFRELELKGWETIESKTRWLQEIYPIDEILARDLEIPLDNINFEKVNSGPIYRIIAEDNKGNQILNESFSPKFIIRNLFDRFPEYEKVRVTTGWFNAVLNGKTIIDERIKTDPENFWDIFQIQVLNRMHDYVLNLYEGKPKKIWAPYFGSMVIDLSLSEPDYRIGIDEEQISSLEAIHEDIYFESLLFFDIMGLFYSGERLSYPGRIIPRINPSLEGKSGEVKIVVTGKKGPNPRVDLKYENKNGKLQRLTEDLYPITIEKPMIIALNVKAGYEGIVSLDVLQKTDSFNNLRDSLFFQSRAESIDRNLLSTEQAKAMIDNISLYHDLGYANNWLSYKYIDKINFILETPNNKSTKVILKQSKKDSYEFPKLKTITPSLNRPMVQWDNPINTVETENIISQLASFPEIKQYYTTTSYLGKNIWAMDVTSPMKGRYISQSKLSVTKPVLFITGRQHANEISSTSHILRLVELIATDDNYKKYLDKVNLVIHPITNPDGADLAYDLQKITPDFMLHAGYLGALGVDVTVGQFDEDPIYPETRVRKMLWETWLPDVILNPHGYPSHQWVQLFAGYSAWVRSRIPNARSWSIPRGWFLPSFDYIDDPKFENHKITAFAIRDSIAKAISNTIPELNKRQYRRYKKYAIWDPDNYKMNIYNDVLIYSTVKGSKVKGGGQSNSRGSFALKYPKVTVFESSTEAPDETAHGEWLQMVANAGLQFDLANLRFLANSEYEVMRKKKKYLDGTTFSISRERPVLPKNKNKKK